MAILFTIAIAAVTCYATTTSVDSTIHTISIPWHEITVGLSTAVVTLMCI
jgi:hypothetical protein